jgi:hypothetical protein
MKRYVLHLLLVLLVPACLYLGAAAQEGAGDAGQKDAAIENRGGEKSGGDATTSEKNGAKNLDRGAVKDTAAETAKKEARKKAEKKKKEAKKPAEKKEAPKAEQVKEDTGVDRESGDSLLLIDIENIKYNRIPGITIKKEDPGQDLVKVPDDKISGASKAEKKVGGIFGKKTSTIAGWGIVIFIFIIFAIYSKTRSRKTKRSTVRTITKR